ncbi:MAG: methyltransferase domain-containing protein [Acidipila sp.]|nr:methyltransferase domain-containing protein [Acidipila sp.]
MKQTRDAYQTTTTGHKLGSGHHLDRHYYALQKEYEETLRAAGFQSGWHVLDAGSGNGLFLPLLSELVGSSGAISAIDLAPENIEEVEELAKSGNLACPVEATVGDLTALPYEDNHFDGLWSANVTQYFTDEQLSQLMGEFRRVVKPNGVIAIKGVDISVWQFQPQHPILMWRLLELESRDNTQLSGAMRGTRLPGWFRDAGLTEIVSKTTLAERRHPLKGVEREYIRGNLEFLSKLAAGQKLPEIDAKEWRAIADTPDALINHLDFCYREMYVLTTGRVPMP